MKISHLLKESILLEASEAIKFMKDSPGGLALAKEMHGSFQMDPNQSFQKIAKLNWTDMKGGSRRDRWSRDFIGTWVVMLFKQGAAAVRYQGHEYTAIVATPDGTISDENFSTSKGVSNFIKQRLGMSKLLASKAQLYMGNIKKTKKVVGTGWRGTELEVTPVGYKNWEEKLKKAKQDNARVPTGGTGGVRQHEVTGPELNKIRHERQKELALVQKSNPKKLLQRFKPLWLKAAKMALADVGGVIQTMAKTGAYERLKTKISRNIDPLELIITNLETHGNLESPGRNYYYGNSATSYAESAIKRAVAMTAVYYYPDETGNVNQQGTPDNEKGVAMLMSDIDRGDMTKLKTILDFFKQELVRASA